MGRSEIRECIRRAQAAEVAGQLEEAVRLLEQAARLHLERAEPSRAVTLLRHGLRLRPQRQQTRELLERALPGGASDPELIPDEPIRVVEVADAQAAPAPVRAVPDEPVEVVELPDAEPVAPPAIVAGGRGMELPPRGPVLAEPGVECWCSFCCRPRAEAGAMVAGPAGAYLCARCLKASAGLLGVEDAAAPAEAPPAPATAAPAAAAAASARGGPPRFVEAAVVLSKELGWSLSEVRSLSPEELRRALQKLEELRDGR